MDQLLKWECRCTLLNDYGESRCVACGAPKSRQQQQKQQQQEQGKQKPKHASSSCASFTSAAETVVYPEEETNTRRERKRGRPSIAQRSRQNKRCRSSSRRDILESALAKPAEATPTVMSNSSAVDSRVRYRSTNGSEIKGICNTTGGDRDAGHSSCASTVSSKSVLATGVTTVFSDGATPQLKSLRSPPFSVSSTATTITTTTTSSEINGSKEEENSAQTSLSLSHNIKRKAIGAALARSAFTKLRGMTWDDVEVDWPSEDNFIFAERRVCYLLGIDTLGVLEAENGRIRRGASDGPRVSAAEGVSGGTGGEADSGEELLVSSLFPLPRPKLARYVKSGIYAKSGAMTPTTSRPEAADVTSCPPSIFQDTAPVSVGYVSPVPIRPSLVARHNGSKPVDDLSEAEVAEGINAPDADGRSASASTIATVDSNLTQYNMDATERSRAYKNIFRDGVDKEKPKKRPRSPVVKIPLRLPFPMAPSEGMGSNVILPCGNRAQTQTKSGSEWQGGLLHGLKSSNVDSINNDRDRTAYDEVKADGDGGHAVDPSATDTLCPRDFRLPYEVMYEYQVEMFNDGVRQLGVRSTADALREFKNIISNVYLSKKPTTKDADEVHRCNCKPPSDGQPGCREACSNRATNEECTPRTCGLGGRASCDNRKIQRYKQECMRRKVCIKDFGAKGIGLVAKKSIPAGSLIGEYVGEVMSEDDWQERQVTLGGKQKHKYVMDLGDGEVIDASQCGSILRFVNHSCGPNAETQKWTIQDKQRIGLFAKDYIEKGVEVTFNYCYVRYDEEARECLCGHPNCVRTLGTKRGEVDEKLEGMSRAKGGGGGGGAGNCNKAGGNGHGNRPNGRGRRGRSSPKLEDPETGETVRRWLHPEDAENIEKYIIRMINNGGRVNARDLAVVKTKRLFLKRNIPLVCRRLVAEQVELVEATSKVEAAGRAKSCTVMEPEEADRRLKAEEAGVLARRLNRLQASIACERALCEKWEEASRTLVCKATASETEPRTSSKQSIVSVAITGESRTPFFEPSTSRTRLFVREMQEEVLRVGRDAMRARKSTTLCSGASSVVAADAAMNGAVGASTPHAGVLPVAADDIAVNGNVREGSVVNGSLAGSSSAAAGNGVEVVSKQGSGRPTKLAPNVPDGSESEMGIGTEGSPARKQRDAPARTGVATDSVLKGKVEEVASVCPNEKHITLGEESGFSKVDDNDQLIAAAAAAADRKVADEESHCVSVENPLGCGSFEGISNGERIQGLLPQELGGSSERCQEGEGEIVTDDGEEIDVEGIPSDAKLHPVSEPVIGLSRQSSSSSSSSGENERSREKERSRSSSRHSEDDKRGSVRGRDERSRRKSFPFQRRDPSTSSSQRSSQSRSSSGSSRSGSRKRRKRSASSCGSFVEDSRGESRSSREILRSRSRDSSRRSFGRFFRRRNGKAVNNSSYSSDSSGPGGREREGSIHRRDRDCESRSPGCGKRHSRSPRRKERDSRAPRRQARVSSSRERSRSEGVPEERELSLRSSEVRNRRGRRHRGRRRRRRSEDPGEQEHSGSQSLARRSRRGSRPRDQQSGSIESRSRHILSRDSRSPPSKPQRSSHDSEDDRDMSSNVESDSSVVSKRVIALKQDSSNGVETHSSKCRSDGNGGLLREEEFSSSQTMALSHVVGEASPAKETQTLSVDVDGDGDGSDSNAESEDSVTFAPALLVMKAKYGDNFYKDLGVEANERLKEEQEVIRVREGQREGTMPPTEDSTKVAREMVGVMIPGASRKLPRDVHRKILEMFQVIILEPFYYPSRSETPPAYVIGPVAHVLHAHKLLAGIHAEKREATITAVLDASMLGALDVRRADTGGNVLKRPKSFDITPPQAEALLDRRRLAWLLGESCRLTGALKAYVSRKRWLRNDGPPVCKVTVEGTLRQCQEAWGILKVGVERYPYVEAFERYHPPPEPTRGSFLRGIASSDINGHGAASGTVTVVANSQGSAPAQSASRVGLQFGQGLGVGFRLTKLDATGVSSEPGVMAEWDDGWDLPVDLIEQSRSEKRGPGYVSSATGSCHSTLDSGGSAGGRDETSRAETTSSSDAGLGKGIAERGNSPGLLPAVEEGGNLPATPSSKLTEETASVKSYIATEGEAKLTTRLAVVNGNVSVPKGNSLVLIRSASNHQVFKNDNRDNENKEEARNPVDSKSDAESHGHPSCVLAPSPDVSCILQKHSSHQPGSSCEMRYKRGKKIHRTFRTKEDLDIARTERPHSEKSHVKKNADKGGLDRASRKKSHVEKHSDKARVDRTRSEKSNVKKHSDKLRAESSRSEKYHMKKRSDNARVNRTHSEKSHMEKDSAKARSDRTRRDKSHVVKRGDKTGVDRSRSEKSHVKKDSGEGRVDRGEKFYVEKHSVKAEVDHLSRENSYVEKDSAKAGVYHSSSEKSHVQKHSDKARIKRRRSDKSRVKKDLDKATVDHPSRDNSHVEKHSTKAGAHHSSRKAHMQKHSEKLRVECPRSDESHVKEDNARTERPCSEKPHVEIQSDNAGSDCPSSERSHVAKYLDNTGIDRTRSEKSNEENYSGKAGGDGLSSEKSYVEKDSDKAGIEHLNCNKSHVEKHSGKAADDHPINDKSYVGKNWSKTGVDSSISEKPHVENHTDKVGDDCPSSDKAHVEKHSDKVGFDHLSCKRSHAEKDSNKFGVDRPSIKSSDVEDSDMARVEYPSSEKSHMDKHPDKTRDDRPNIEKPHVENGSYKTGIDRSSIEKSHIDKHPDKVRDDRPGSVKSHVEKDSNKIGIDRSSSERPREENSDKARVDRRSSKKSQVEKNSDKAEVNTPSGTPRRSRDRAHDTECGTRWLSDKRSSSRDYPMISRTQHTRKRSNSRSGPRNQDSRDRKRSLIRTRSPEGRRSRQRQQCNRRRTLSSSPRRSRSQSHRPNPSSSLRRNRRRSRRRSRRPSPSPSLSCSSRRSRSRNHRHSPSRSRSSRHSRSCRPSSSPSLSRSRSRSRLRHSRKRGHSRSRSRSRSQSRTPSRSRSRSRNHNRSRSKSRYRLSNRRRSRSRRRNPSQSCRSRSREKEKLRHRDSREQARRNNPRRYDRDSSSSNHRPEAEKKSDRCEQRRKKTGKRKYPIRTSDCDRSSSNSIRSDSRGSGRWNQDDWDQMSEESDRSLSSRASSPSPSRGGERCGRDGRKKRLHS